MKFVGTNAAARRTALNETMHITLRSHTVSALQPSEKSLNCRVAPVFFWSWFKVPVSVAIPEHADTSREYSRSHSATADLSVRFSSDTQPIRSRDDIRHQHSVVFSFGSFQNPMFTALMAPLQPCACKLKNDAFILRRYQNVMNLRWARGGFSCFGRVICVTSSVCHCQNHGGSLVV